MTALYIALCQAGLAHPLWAMPGTEMSPSAYLRAGGPFGAFMGVTYSAAIKP
jgi:hypothetical protein